MRWVKNVWGRLLCSTEADFCFTGGVLLCVLYVAAVVMIVMVTGEPFGYPLDDSYIHMAIGRTLATSGVFFYVPLILNVIFACGVIMLLLTMFRPQPASVALTAAIVFAASLPSLSIVGMEHLLHALLAAALCFVACHSIAKPPEGTPVGELASIGLLAGLAVAARYERLFLVAPLMVLSAIRWRWRTAMALGVGAALPLLGFGLLWMHNGGWLLANSLIIKTSFGVDTELIAGLRHVIETLLGNLSKTIFRGGFGAMLSGLGGLLFWHLYRRSQVWDTPVLFALCALSATGEHLATDATAQSGAISCPVRCDAACGWSRARKERLRTLKWLPAALVRTTFGPPERRSHQRRARAASWHRCRHQGGTLDCAGIGRLAEPTAPAWRALLARFCVAMFLHGSTGVGNVLDQKCPG